MTYTGRVKNGVVILDGPQRPRGGAVVRVEEAPVSDEVGKALDKLAGQAEGVPTDWADRHDHYRTERPRQ